MPLDMLPEIKIPETIKADPQDVRDLTVLKAARAKIAKPEHWTQGTGARDRDGLSVSPQRANAFSFCSYGAVEAVLPAMLNGRRRAINHLKRLVPFGQLATFNDDHTHAEVLNLFDKAIARLEANL